MSLKQSIEKTTEKMLDPIMEENQFELVDVEYVKEGTSWYLRVYIDKEGGITIDDCELVSRALEEKLDQDDPIPSHYILEVSSPGLDRPLKKEKDFNRSIGKLVELKLYQAIDQQKEFTGTLKNYEKDTVTIAFEDGKEQVFKLSDIALIKLAVVF